LPISGVDVTTQLVTLAGKVNLCSADHIGLLVHKTFNASIPRHSIPTDSWEFQYGPAENDPEFGAGADEEEGLGEESTGRWIHRVTGDAIGDKDGNLEFVVTGYVFLQCTVLLFLHVLPA
jgi:DNA-directed RNA polymerase I subunit RPA43